MAIVENRPGIQVSGAVKEGSIDYGLTRMRAIRNCFGVTIETQGGTILAYEHVAKGCYPAVKVQTSNVGHMENVLSSLGMTAQIVEGKYKPKSEEKGIEWILILDYPQFQ